jgi:uncharacterized protein YraI
MSPIVRKYLVGAIVGVIGSSVMNFSATAADVAHGATVAGANMYAGPSERYPQVMHLGPSLQVSIHGCAADLQWCDVSWRGKRGWVSAAALEYHDNGEAMPVAATTAIPTATFEFSRYWEANYRSRLWYSDRAKWQSLEGRGAQRADAGILLDTP